MSETVGKMLDASLAAIAKALDANEKAHSEIALQIESIKARLEVLESDEPTTPEPPEPVTPWPVFLVNLDNGVKTPFVGGAVNASQGRYTVEVGEGEALNVPRPVAFKLNGESCGNPENNVPLQAAGDNNPLPFVAGANEVEIIAGDTAPVNIRVTIEGAAPGPNPEPIPEPEPGQRSKLQTSDWYLASFNPMEVTANLFHASGTDWSGGGMRAEALIEAGHIDRKTGLPVSLPDGKTLTSGVYFSGGADVMPHWDGEWVLEADCTGDVELAILYIPKERVKRISPCRLEFTREYAGAVNPTIYHHQIQVTKLNGTLKNLRLYRAENAERIKAGMVTSKRFADAMVGYDVLRMMDGQNANKAVIRSVDDVPSMDAAQWSNVEWQAPETFAKPFQGMPLAAPFMAAVETDTELWHHAPITIGAPEPFMDFRPEDGAIDKWAGAYRAMARKNAASIIASPEWDRYADALVAAMIEAGYPENRVFYTTVANEVWNFSGQYFMTTNYAWGIGEGLNYNVHEPLRVGYGALMARWKLALDGALDRAGRTQPVEYVIEGQAYYPNRTMFALTGAKAYLESKGEMWEDHAPAFGVSVATYWAATWDQFASPEEWPALIEADPDGTAQRFADFIINDPAQFGLPSVLDMLRQNKARGDEYGVKFLGAYEGGSHLERPSYVSKEWYAAFHWGEQGARVNTAVNAAIAKAFPGFILSNYVLAGPTGGQPWFDYMYDQPTPLSLSWEPFKKGE